MMPKSPPSIGLSTSQIRLSVKDRIILVESVDRDLEMIENACRRGDENTLMACIHSLKGALFIIGEHAVANECGVVEEFVRAQGLGHCGADIERLKQVLRQLQDLYATNGDVSPTRLRLE